MSRAISEYNAKALNIPSRPLAPPVGLALGISGLVITSSYALSITSVATILDWRYLVGFVAVASFGWFWLGVDSIPGKRKRSSGPLHQWWIVGIVLILGGSMGYVPVLKPIGDSVFAAFFLSLAAKATWSYFVMGRQRYCQKCGMYRWFLRMDGELYCNKHGHNWESRP